MNENRMVGMPLAITLSFAPIVTAFAQAVAPSAAGYDVERSQSVERAPPGSIGRKTTDRERRVGNTEDTLGNEATRILTFGGFVRRCPTPEGIVPGEFEYAIMSDEIDANDSGMQRTHHSRRLIAHLEAHVGDDAKVRDIELEGQLAIEGDGTRESRPIRQTFRPGASGIDWPALESAVRAAGDVGVAAIVVWAGEFYKAAELEWWKPSECVEFSFEPPSDTRALGPNESAQVRAELRSKQGGAPVPWQTDSIGALQGQGTVSPRPARAADGAGATLTYTAAAQPRRGHGIDLAATSRAGVGEGKWRITEGGIKLTIEHSLRDDRGTPGALMGEALFGGTVKFEITLAPFPALPGRFRGSTTVRRQLQVTHITPRCRGVAWQSEGWDITATIDTEQKSIELEPVMYPNDAAGQWTCVPGGTDELNVVETAEVERLVVPAVIGTPQTFEIPRADRDHETVTVTVLESPVVR